MAQSNALKPTKWSAFEFQTHLYTLNYLIETVLIFLITDNSFIFVFNVTSIVAFHFFLLKISTSFWKTKFYEGKKCSNLNFIFPILYAFEIRTVFPWIKIKKKKSKKWLKVDKKVKQFYHLDKYDFLGILRKLNWRYHLCKQENSPRRKVSVRTIVDLQRSRRGSWRPDGSECWPDYENRPNLSRLFSMSSKENEIMNRAAEASPRKYSSFV